MGTYYIGFAPRHIRVQMKKLLEKKHRYGKDNFLTVVYDTGKIDSDGNKLYHIGLYKQELGMPVVSKENIDDILDFLKDYENNQTVNGNKTETIKELEED